MCGILALHCDSKDLQSEFMKALKLQEHRGPDETRYCTFQDINLLLGSNRLSIIDQKYGSQPLQNDERTIAISFNGEIFNAPELRKSLVNSGVLFNSHHSDTEVILRGYIKYGLEFISMLNGMFAIIIIDKLKGKLIGIRDRFGIKPFHYITNGNFIVCSSELMPLLKLMKDGDLKISIDLDSVREYLQIGFISAPRTIYSNVKVLEPGYSIEFDLTTKSIIKSRWWNKKKENWGCISEPELPKMVRNEFLEAVSRWTYSDYDLALSLSGGMDSTCILVASKILGIKLDTFSLVFEHSNLYSWDESKNINRIVQTFGNNHSPVHLSAVELSQSLSKIVTHLGQPYGGGLPSFKVFKEVSKSHRVCLTGTGGDELFGNYGRHNLVGNSDINSQQNFDKNYTQVLYKSRMNLLERIFLDLDFSRKTNDWFSNFQSDINAKPEERLEQISLSTQLPDEFLFATDRLSMMYSVEARTPFLDHIFAEKILSINSQIRHQLPMKKLLKSAFKVEFEKLQLSELKRGFSLPLSVWIRNELREWAENAINNHKMMEYVNLDIKFLNRVFDDFSAGNNENVLILWRIVMFSAWLNASEFL